MAHGYACEQLKAVILALSRATYWEMAKKVAACRDFRMQPRSFTNAEAKMLKRLGYGSEAVSWQHSQPK